MKWTTELPTTEGFYWYCDFWNGGSPTGIVEVTKHDGELWANNEELGFVIKPRKRTKRKKETDKELWEKGSSFSSKYAGIEFWCKIPEPEKP